jgi:hypothetical protein
MPRFDKYDMQAEILRWMASALIGFSLQFDREGDHFNEEIKERRQRISSSLFEIADKLRSVAHMVED